MNFVIKEHDPLEAALQRFQQFNAADPADREYSETQLIDLVVNQIKHGD